MTAYSLSLLIGFVVAAAVFAYRAARLRPIPGIPFAPRSVRSILGDVPEALKVQAETSCITSFLLSRLEELQSPVVQVFMRPFGRPWVVVADARETQDILARRTREFDRSQFFIDTFRAILPNKLAMNTHDQWRFNRRLMADTMSSAFLQNVAAPQVYQKTLDLIDLWRQKERLACGAAFAIHEDIKMCTVDTIWAAAFGENIGACKTQSQALAELDRFPANTNQIVDIPCSALSSAYLALKGLMDSCEIPINSPLGFSHHWLAVNLYPSLRRIVAVKNELVTSNIQAAWDKFGKSKDVKTVKSAAEFIVERETSLARKEGRDPLHHSQFIRDELTTLLGAGYETTSTAIAWGIKYLAYYPQVQVKLRNCLKKAYPTTPTPENIVKNRVPYLDAFIEESLRIGATVPVITRTTTVDTNILGYAIPKGTDVFLMTIGPSFTAPATPIDEAQRSKTSREYGTDAHRWIGTDLENFRPERWLIQHESGAVQFDSRAAPMQVFGGGVRACFGRKLAYLEMHVIFTLLVWNFEIHSPPQDYQDLKAEDKLTRRPQTCFVGLTHLE